MSAVQDEAAKIALAQQFLTRVPIPNSVVYTEQRFADIPRYFPLIGLFIGTLCSGVYLVAIQAFAQPLAVTLMVIGSVLLTGAFHEDGLADTFDGVGGGLTRNAALEIMKDSRLGTYGTLALALVLMGKIAALVSLPISLVVVGLIAAHCLSRLSSVIVMATSEYVRDHGTAKPVSRGISTKSLLIALVTGVLSLIGLAVFVSFFAALYCVMGLAIGHVLMRLLYARKLKGYTGDTLGAVQQVSELGVYLGLAAWA